MKSTKDFNRAAWLALVEKVGGEMALLEQIKETQQRGDITKKQAFDLRKAVKKACLSSEMSLFVQNDVIAELDRKVTEAALYYR